MKSKEKKSIKNNVNTAIANNVTEEKLRFPLYMYQDTMEKVDMLYESDDCRSKTEFMEKAIRFYCGYIMSNENTSVDYIASQLSVITEGIIKGTEQRLS